MYLTEVGRDEGGRYSWFTFLIFSVLKIASQFSFFWGGGGGGVVIGLKIFIII